ncbi:hypothetical protein BTHI11S_04670 [Bosea thiooxidans]
MPPTRTGWPPPSTVTVPLCPWKTAKRPPQLSFAWPLVRVQFVLAGAHVPLPPSIRPLAVVAAPSQNWTSGISPGPGPAPTTMLTWRAIAVWTEISSRGMPPGAPVTSRPLSVSVPP